MGRRDDIESIVLIGAGPIVIGQACEFDYSGTQACKALREEGYRVILINSNPATIMTDPDTADATYIEPLTPESVKAVLDKELARSPRGPIAMLPTMGGQVALNIAMALAEEGYLEANGIELLGAGPEVIRKAEDRACFRQTMAAAGIECARSTQVRSVEEGLEAIETIGLPAILRPSFTLGGTGGGIATTREELREKLAAGLRASPVGSVLIEASLLGWKEYELEVVRDRADNAIVICSIENIDPMGVHTGDSITVAPALTLTDKEYQRMRDRAITCMRAIGVETGGSNVQFAVNPADGRQVLIEMNPRVSRSSALASKATGFPIARVAAKLAVGYTLAEIRNEITGTTPASFEPTLDYVVTKIPRFDFAKFPEAAERLTTSMQSVGEVMAIGRTFAQSMHKALRSLECGLTGYDRPEGELDDAALRQRLGERVPMRVLLVAEALRRGIAPGEIAALTGIDPWFIEQIGHSVAVEQQLASCELDVDDPDALLALKKEGLADARIAALAGRTEAEVRALRHAHGITPVIKRIDTCGGEFPSRAAYMYSAYEGDGRRAAQCEARVSTRRKIAVLGSGPNRIGQGIEFDYCCVHACGALAEMGFETIMVNCNPETVSTDYDTSDRLYFEPLTTEDVIEVLRIEQRRGELVGVVVQVGGQTPLKLAQAIEAAGIPILGTAPDAIDRCEDRERFKALVDALELKQPENRVARSAEEAQHAAEAIGYPVMLRPSYVLGGQAMAIVDDDQALREYITGAVRVSHERPVLIERCLRGAVECDVDVVADGHRAEVAGVMEHIEPAGVHSGDSACVIPPYTLGEATVEEMKRQSRALAEALGVVGLMNVQFAVSGGEVYLIEVNPRASRTVPFVAKATGRPWARIAIQVLAGKDLEDALAAHPAGPALTAVKEAVIPFARFGSDPVLGPEMKSTGEVMGFGKKVEHAFARAQEAAGCALAPSGAVLLLSSVPNGEAQSLVRRLSARGVPLRAPEGVLQRLNGHGEDRVEPFNGRDSIGLVLDPWPSREPEARAGRRYALEHAIPYFTTERAAELALRVRIDGPGPCGFRPTVQDQARQAGPGEQGRG